MREAAARSVVGVTRHPPLWFASGDGFSDVDPAWSFCEVDEGALDGECDEWPMVRAVDFDAPTPWRDLGDVGGVDVAGTPMGW